MIVNIDYLWMAGCQSLPNMLGRLIGDHFLIHLMYYESKSEKGGMN